MTAPITPQQTRRRMIQLLNFEDGLWDILLGLIFLELSIYPVTRRLLGPVWNMVLYLTVLGVLVLGLTLVRRAISRPRIGTARMRRTPAKAVLVAFLVVSLLATFALVLLTLRSPGWLSIPAVPIVPSWMQDLSVDIAMMFIVVLVFSVMGYVFRVVRLFLYGWLIGLGNLASTALTLYAGVPFNLPLAIASMIMLGTGVVLLVRFLRSYPVGGTPEAA
jgi:hypothetical protein